MGDHEAQDLGTVITNATARQVIYGTYVIGLLVVGASSAACLAIQVSQPAWLIAATAVFTFLGVPVGSLAAANVRKN